MPEAAARSFWLLTASTLLCFALPGSSFAQFTRVTLKERPSPPADAVSGAQADESRQLASPLVQVATDPTLVNSFRAAVPSVSIGIYRDAKKKTIAAQAKIAQLKGQDLSLTFASPFDSEDEETVDLADLNGLLGATSGELALSSAAAQRMEYRAALRVGHHEFNFVDATSFVRNTANKTEWSAQLSGGYIWSQVSAHFGYRHEETFKGAPATQICAPFGPPGGLRCSNASVGGPTKGLSHIVEGDTRILLANQDRATLGLSPSLHYDFQDEILGLELPLYFLPDEKGGGLAGGVRAGFVHDKPNDANRFTFAVFLGNVFSLKN